MNIEANLGGITDQALVAELTGTAKLADSVTDRADRRVAAVREEISRCLTASSGRSASQP